MIPHPIRSDGGTEGIEKVSPAQASESPGGTSWWFTLVISLAIALHFLGVRNVMLCLKNIIKNISLHIIIGSMDFIWERERGGCYHIKLDVTLADSVCQILNFGLEPDCVPRNMSYPVHSNFPRDWPRFTAQTTDVFTLLVLGCTLQLHT